jgi:hypothetical protein
MNSRKAFDLTLALVGVLVVLGMAGIVTGIWLLVLSFMFGGCA